MAEAPPGRVMWVALEWVVQHCVIPNGFRKGAPFDLYEYQGRFLGNFYRVKRTARWDPVNPVLAPAFVYRRGILIGPQKVGKSPFVGAHVCLEGVGPVLFAGWAGEDEAYVCADWGCPCGWVYVYEPGEPKGMPWPTPLIQITAFSEESTDNTYDALRPMIELGPLADVIPKTGEEFIRLPHGGRIDVVTSSALSRLGQRVTFVPQDEVGVWTHRNKMISVADTQHRGLAGMGGRAAMTTNMWDPSEKSLAQRDFYSRAQDIYRQCDRAPTHLSFRDKRERRRILKAVYPSDTRRENGGHVDLDSIEAEAVGMMEHDAPQAMRFFGNLEVASGGAAVDPMRWDELADARVVVPDGARIGVGFDGSISQDCTAIIGCYLVPVDGEDDAGDPLPPRPHWFVPTHFAGGEERPTIWQRPPDAPKDWRIPRAEVKRAVQALFARYDIGRFVADPPKWQTELEEWAEQHGDDIVIVFDTNQPKKMSEACDRYSTHIGHAGDASRAATHDGNSILRDHVTAMVRRKAYNKIEDEADGRVRYVFTKPDDGRKIDAGIGSVLALVAALTMPAPKPRRTLRFAWAGGEDDAYDEEDDWL